MKLDEVIFLKTKEYKFILFARIAINSIYYGFKKYDKLHNFLCNLSYFLTHQ